MALSADFQGLSCQFRSSQIQSVTNAKLVPTVVDISCSADRRYLVPIAAPRSNQGGPFFVSRDPAAGGARNTTPRSNLAGSLCQLQQVGEEQLV